MSYSYSYTWTSHELLEQNEVICSSKVSMAAWALFVPSPKNAAVRS